MAKGGPSVIITAEQHDLKRRERKAAQRRKSGHGPKGHASGTDLMSMVHKDKQMALATRVEQVLETEDHKATNQVTTLVVTNTIKAFVQAVRDYREGRVDCIDFATRVAKRKMLATQNGYATFVHQAVNACRRAYELADMAS